MLSTKARHKKCCHAVSVRRKLEFPVLAINGFTRRLDVAETMFRSLLRFLFTGLLCYISVVTSNSRASINRKLSPNVYGRRLTHTRLHRLIDGEGTCNVDGSPCKASSDCSSGLCAGLYALREEDVYNRLYGPLESVDNARLSLRMYPYNNATSWSLQQYKDPVNNGNDYNLVGENVGDATDSAYIPLFYKRTTPTLSLGRRGLTAINVGTKIIWAGGSIGHLPSNESARVDIYDTVTETFSHGDWLSVARKGISAASTCMNNKGYCSHKIACFVGGHYTTTGKSTSFVDPNNVDPIISNVVDCYDADTDTWTVTGGNPGDPTCTQKAYFGNCMVQGRAYASAVMYGTKMYVAGGTRGYFETSEYTKNIEVYDVVTWQWESWWKDDTPPNYGVMRSPFELSKARGMMCATVGDGLIFFAGGNEAGFYSFTNPTLVTDVVDIFNATSRTWMKAAKLSEARSSCSAEYMNGQAYFAGGLNKLDNSDRVDMYTTKTGAWSRAILSQARQGMVSGVLSNGTVVFVGGLTFGGYNRWNYEAHSKNSPRVDLFDGVDWKSDFVPQGHSEHAGAAYGDIIYVAGGVDNMNRFVDRIERIEKVDDCLDYKCFRRSSRACSPTEVCVNNLPITITGSTRI